MPMLIGLVRTAGPLPPERSRIMPSSACWTTVVCSFVRFSSPRTIPTIGLLCTNQSHKCSPDWNSVFSVIVSTLIAFSPAFANSWRSLSGSCSWKGSGRGSIGGPSNDGMTDWMAPTKKPKNSILWGSPYTFISTRPPGLVTRHLTYSARHVRKEHDTELRPGDIEGVVLQLEGVAVHDTGLDVEPLLARTRIEMLEHDRR